MESINITNAKKHLYKLVIAVGESHSPILITGKNNNAVLISEDDWKSIEETVYLNAIPGMVESIKESANEPLESMKRLEEIN